MSYTYKLMFLIKILYDHHSLSQKSLFTNLTDITSDNKILLKNVNTFIFNLFQITSYNNCLNIYNISLIFNELSVSGSRVNIRNISYYNVLEFKLNMKI